MRSQPWLSYKERVMKRTRNFLMSTKMRGAAWLPREELSSASPHGNVLLFPLCLDHISNFSPHFHISPFALWWGWRHQTHAGECLKHNNGKWILWAFLAIFPKEHLAATLSNFPVLCKLLAPAAPTSPGLWWELSVRRSRRVWRASPVQAWFPASGQGQVLFVMSSVPNVSYRWN